MVAFHTARHKACINDRKNILLDDSGRNRGVGVHFVIGQLFHRVGITVSRCIEQLVSAVPSFRFDGYLMLGMMHTKQNRSSYRQSRKLDLRDLPVGIIQPFGFCIICDIDDIEDNRHTKMVIFADSRIAFFVGLFLNRDVLKLHEPVSLQIRKIMFNG